MRAGWDVIVVGAGLAGLAAGATATSLVIQPYSGHAARQSLEMYSRLALADAQ